LSVTHSLFLLLGANLGHRFQTLSRAVALLHEHVGPVRARSGLYETAPWGVVDQPLYLNQVVQLGTGLATEAVLDRTQQIETELGRVRAGKWGSRLIDIDLLFYDDLVLTTNRLTLPHPLLHHRRFTLVPLADIAPDLVHPVLGQSIRALLADCDDHEAVTPVKLG
jgi:2-amino-4-hydroxy-6-hydroxymethyldihydropteridine diphosphokinase